MKFRNTNRDIFVFGDTFSSINYNMVSYSTFKPNMKDDYRFFFLSIFEICLSFSVIVFDVISIFRDADDCQEAFRLDTFSGTFTFFFPDLMSSCCK